MRGTLVQLTTMISRSMVASTHGNHNIYITDVRSGRVVKTLSGHPRTPWCIAFHPSSNQILASGCLGGQVRVWDLHIDRGTDPMDAPMPSTSARPGAPSTSTAHCEYCQVDLVGRSRSSSTASNASSSSTSSNSRPTSSPNRTLTDEASSNASEESRPPPRGTNEISASHSSSRLVSTSTSLPSTSSAFVAPLSRSPSAVTPSTSAPTSHPTPSAPTTSGGHAVDRTVLLRNLKALYMYNRLHRFRAQVETGRNMLVMARTISLMSPSAPGDAGPLIDDPPSEAFPPPPPPPGPIPSTYSPSSSLVFPPLPSPPPSPPPPPPPPPPLPTPLRSSSTPPTPTSSSPSSSGRRILPNILNFMSSFLNPTKDQQPSTSGTTPPNPEDSGGPSSRLPDPTDSNILEPPTLGQLVGDQNTANSSSASPSAPAETETPSSSNLTVDPEDQPSHSGVLEPPASSSPLESPQRFSGSSELATLRRFCNFDFIRRPFNNSPDPPIPSGPSSSQDGHPPRSRSSSTPVASTSSQAGPSTTCGSARSRVFLGSSPSSSRQPDEPAAEPQQSEDEQSTTALNTDENTQTDGSPLPLAPQPSRAIVIRVRPSPSPSAEDGHPSSQEVSPRRGTTACPNCSCLEYFSRPSSSGGSGPTQPPLMTIKCLRTRVRHWLLLMLDSLTQFFENDSFVRNPNPENASERISTSTSSGGSSSSSGGGPVASTSGFPGSSSAWSSPGPPSSASSSGNRGVRLPILLLNDGPVPSEADANPPAQSAGSRPGAGSASAAGSHQSATARPASPMRLHHPRRYLHAYHHHGHDHHVSDDSSEEPSNQDRSEVLFFNRCVYSLSWGSLGQCLYTTSFEQNAVSVSLSPTARHLVVGLASRRIFLLQAERPTTSVAQIFRLEGGKLVLKTDSPPAKGKLALVRDLQIGEFVDFMSINCIRWSPVPGQGLIYGTNSGKLKILR
ncbi:unnamed protein product [Nesidiocoris tenuis]|uniref:Uncharacterized protein n=1 Tax=Nesidiocoris tenuis TaxID=355587 RepID=A0A6H5HVV6_9HEMI|nr:unnamed protein product [Nesidiocoris tenuis]